MLFIINSLAFSAFLCSFCLAFLYIGYFFSHKLAALIEIIRTDRKNDHFSRRSVPSLTFGLLRVIGLKECFNVCNKIYVWKNLCININMYAELPESWRRVSIGYISFVQFYLFLQLYLHIKTCTCTARLFAEMHNYKQYFNYMPVEASIREYAYTYLKTKWKKCIHTYVYILFLNCRLSIYIYI